MSMNNTISETRSIARHEYTLENGKCNALYKLGRKACFECIFTDCKNSCTRVTKDESVALDMIETYIKSEKYTKPQMTG